jgi:Putative auto-transporter adhesin, head GIN domain
MQSANVTRVRRMLLVAGALAPLAHALADVNGNAPAAERLALFGGSGDRIEGSGKVVDEERGVGGFTRLIVSGPLDVSVRAGDADHVVVHADDNIAPLIETKVHGSTLVVGLRPGASYRTRTKAQIRVHARQMQGVVLRGSGDVRADRIEAEVFEATLQGSGDIVVDSLRAGAVAVSLAGNGDVRMTGTAGSLGVVLDGSGDVHCADLPAQQVAVRIRGSGDARVHATEELKVDIDGSGDVRYRGAPKISKSIRGSGSVEPLK